jgi:tetratricopeptide (TPR) repeat protein
VETPGRQERQERQDPDYQKVRTWRLGVYFIIALLIALAAPAARADPTPPAAMSEDARAHYERGLELYSAKDYAGAIRELDAGYALDPRREFLFAEAQAHRLNGDCKSAVPLYKKFLETDPDDVQVNAAHIALARCAEQMATAPAPPAPSTKAPPIGTSAPVLPPPGAPAPAAPWYKDSIGGVLLGAGVAALAVGTGFSLAALSARDDANQNAGDYPDFTSRWSTARGRSQIAAGAFAAGAALTGAAIYRYWRVRRAHASAVAKHGLDAWAAPVTAAAAGGGASGAIAGVGGYF